MVQRAQQLRKETWTYEKLNLDESPEIELPPDDSWPIASALWPELLNIISAIVLLLAGLAGATSLLDEASLSVPTETVAPYRDDPYFASIADAVYATDWMVAAGQSRPPTLFSTAADAAFGSGSLPVVDALRLSERATPR